ncbi:MAG TPA: hypothetical protein VEA60_05380, partial [Allosphingosinicella sp.]|nr:hypothetical protein [Allosphingosinicella sp.]
MPLEPVFERRRTFTNFHKSYKEPTKGLWELHLADMEEDNRTSIADLKETTRQLQGLIAEARKPAVPVPIRAVGSRWSLSTAPATAGWALETNRLIGRFKVPADAIDPAYP